MLIQHIQVTTNFDRHADFLRRENSRMGDGPLQAFIEDDISMEAIDAFSNAQLSTNNTLTHSILSPQHIAHLYSSTDNHHLFLTVVRHEIRAPRVVFLYLARLSFRWVSEGDRN